ncbi:MAG: hypothetical protein QNJ31_09230 [Candidatus Caenarcaniphilales bacterium]|nr:hypothetical protein [Candidatus Caenarcaniphilales bacterium]
MSRRKCPKCNSTKTIKKGYIMENNASNARIADINLSKELKQTSKKHMKIMLSTNSPIQSLKSNMEYQGRH